MNWKLGSVSLSIAILFWLASMVVQPYTTWGDPPKIRTAASNGIVGVAVICLVFLLISSLVYWKRENRRGWKAIVFALALLFFGGTALARFIYVRFYILG